MKKINPTSKQDVMKGVCNLMIKHGKIILIDGDDIDSIAVPIEECELPKSFEGSMVHIVKHEALRRLISDSILLKSIQG